MDAKGFSLVEVLVSVLIATLALAIGLALYDQSRRSFKQGENTTELQQAARVALDMLSADIRDAGFNVNPDGHRLRPDEPIEAAWPTALVLRADFDARDPVDSGDPEQVLAGAGSAFATVTTGNDEIRAYLLSKPGSVETLEFHVDAGQAVRDGLVEAVTLDRVARTHDAPPYTLYRLTLNNDPATCCRGRFVVRTPVVENVRALRFRYYDHGGNELVPGGGDESASAIVMRASIRRIGVELEAQTRDPDPVTGAHRTFRLAVEVVPRNAALAVVAPEE